ncbi:sulfotransferase [Qipengyuania sp. XHP0211]|uniref:sulfotransferase family protein n=1 Tax=Qipengyuania sp. XHP0211 TaxID=3038079 RepID=UPI00241CFAA6|nr:sulfotransferase [Qipengyuania sp. XHP0211]MDG5750963.1 sulfotransferase [Qipengyuania sp. XHP0211]
MATTHIFVTGASRSGTTLLARVLGGGAEVADLRELHFLEQMVTGEEFSSGEALDPARTDSLVRRLLAGVRDGYFRPQPATVAAGDVSAVIAKADPPTCASVYREATLFAARQAGKTIALDQTPRNLFYIDEILQGIPTAKVVCMVRDPRDVVLSQKGKWKRRSLGADIPLAEAIRSWANYHPFVMAKMWRQAAAAARKATLRNAVMLVRFEDLLENPETTVRAICAHCEIAFDETMLDVARVGSSNREDQSSARGIDRTRTGAWQKGLSLAEIAIVEKAAEPLLAESGYAPSCSNSSKLARAGWGVALPLKMSLALALNLRRIRNLRAWASKRLKA